MKKVIVPTDFSNNAADALDYAINFIGEEDAIIKVVHVINTNIMMAEAAEASADIIQLEVKRVKEMLFGLKQFSRLNCPLNILIETEVLVGLVSPMLKQAAHDFGADYIVIGTRGKGHSRVDKWLGTVSVNVLRDAPCPILLIPANYKFSGMENAVFCTTLESGDLYEIRRSIELLSEHKPKMHGLHVVEGEVVEPQNKLVSYMQEIDQSGVAIDMTYKVPSKPSLEAAIQSFAKSENADVIIMHKSKDNFWKSLMQKSKTRTMASMIEVPLLVLE